MWYTLSKSLHWYLAFKQKHVIQQIWQPGVLSRCGAGLDQSYLFVSISTFEQSIPIERLFFKNSGAEIRSKCWMWFSKTWIVERRRMDHCGLIGQFPPTISSIKNLQFLWAKRQFTFPPFPSFAKFNWWVVTDVQCCSFEYQWYAYMHGLRAPQVIYCLLALKLIGGLVRGCRYLGNNSMTGPLPKELGSLVNLQEL